MRTVSIIETTKTKDDIFFILSMNDDGMIHTEKLSHNNIIKALRKGAKFYIDIDNEEFYHHIINLDYRFMEISDESEEDEKIFDCYIYDITVNDDVIFIDYEKSYFTKTYKSMKTAENLAKKLKIKHVFYT